MGQQNILLIGAAGFIGTNLAIKLSENAENRITLVDKHKEYFAPIRKLCLSNVFMRECSMRWDLDFDEIVRGQDIVYHLFSTTVPSTSNHHISQELQENVIFTSNLLEACIHGSVKKVIFLSSGGAVYGKETDCPLKEETPADPISAYGIQKVTIEKLLYLYKYLYGLDYRIIRLSNPYGPYQRPNGILGAVTTFTYKALRGEEIFVYGDGTVVRDFIYIDDAVCAIRKVADLESKQKIFNVGCGYGTSIGEVLEMIQNTLRIKLHVTYGLKRKVDVPVNYLDITKYEKYCGKLNLTSMEEGILRTAEFMKKEYGLI